MKNHYYILTLLLVFLGCNKTEKKKNNFKESTKIEVVNTPILNLEQANRLAQLPLHCVSTEYPNKLNQTIGNASDLKRPNELHPAFYGCFDWYSAVHGHRSLGNAFKAVVYPYRTV